MLTPKTQFADMLTKGSFTRDEWNHLLRLLNFVNFSMFSCSHFLSNKKQSVMAKRVQESTSEEVSAVAKPRPINLVSRSFLSTKKLLRKIRVLRTAWGIKNWLRVMFHPALRNSRETATKTQQRILKERQQDDTQFSSHRKLGRSGEPPNSASTRQLEGGDDI